MNNTYPFEAMPLPYGYGQLAPYIDGRTVRVHYNMHYKRYIEKLNVLLSEYPVLQSLTLEQILKNPSALPEKSRVEIMRNAGGVYNHQLYFSGMGRRSDTLPSAKLRFAISSAFGSFEDFKRKFITAGMSVFGSGYVWLVYDKTGKLMIVTTPNQETPLEFGLEPIMCCDVWEHAYYLQYLNGRENYLTRFFNVINWKAVEARM